MTKPVLSIVKATTDNASVINFYLILNNGVIASAKLVFPFDPMPVLMAGFTTEIHRRKGYWNILFSARIKWIKNNNPDAEYVHLYVDADNTMGGHYLAMGFEYSGGTNIDNGCKWMRLKLNN